MRTAGLLLLGLLAWAADARADAAYLAELQRQAEAAGLAARREWHVLLHYRATADGAGVVSDADDPRFFLAPTGKTDPQAELRATLAAFFQTDPVGGDPQPAQCAFPARYHWLQAALAFDPRRLPPQPCERLQRWLHELNAATVTLVFASAYLNNPASLFGHTLLRLDPRGQTEQTRLLAYTINYAADDSHSNLLLYAVDGIAGGFQGRFLVEPYYKLVRTYSDLESRDIWEYRLKLSAGQLQRLLEHAWELRGIVFAYYFFRENCAWQLLTLLEVADPSLHLSDRYPLWTLPADTIRQLVRQPGLVDTITPRPARGTRISRRYAVLTPAERRLVRQLRDDPATLTSPAFARLAPQRQALVLELALDDRQHRRAARAAKGQEEPPADPVDHRLLSARNQLAATAPPLAIEPYATQPESGHDSARAGLGIGQQSGNRFLELSARASYHDLLEPDAGYTPDAQIEGLSLAVRYYPTTQQWRLNRLTVLDITSLPPIDALAPRPAWRIHAGWEPYPLPTCPTCTAFNLSGGAGIAAETGWPWRTVWFGLPTVAFDYGSEFASDHRAGFGLMAGAVLQPTVRWKILADASWLDYRLGATGSALRATLRQHLALSRDWALRADWRSLEGSQEFAVGLLVYF